MAAGNKGGEGHEAPSLSVLYLANDHPDGQNDHIPLGITEDLIAGFSRIEGLRVIPRADVLPFRNRDVDAVRLAESLFVRNVLDGSMQKAGDQVRLNVRLTDVDSGRSLWSDDYDGPFDEIFDVQAKVVESVSSALGIPPDRVTSDAETWPHRTDVRAYEFYLRSRELLAQRGGQKAERAIDLLEKVIAIDPSFAPAYAALAEAYASMFTYYDGDGVWLSRMGEVSERALALDPHLVEARFSAGLAHFHRKAFAEAKSALRSVISARPYHYDSYWWLGIVADLQGDYDEALDCYASCAAIKPYSVEPWLYMNMSQRRKGDTAGAVQSAKHFLEVGIRTLEMTPDDAVTLSRFAVVYTLFGDYDKARAVLSRVVASGTEDGLVLYNCASTYALLGDVDDALDCLRHALENGFRNVLEWVKEDPDFERLRQTSRFEAMLNRFAPDEDV